ncbi:M15 family metallopeptidase [Dysosmobacter sp. NSJ-60]|nr:M15 family metallopeptidase [Dysosmobacter hominis]
MADLRPVEPLKTSPTVAKSEVSADDWQLLLVNPWNQLPEGYTVELTELRNGHAVDTRAYPDLQRMMDDCRAAGLEPVICSSYRTLETQQRLYENKIRRLMNEGLSREEATAQAGTVVAVPGTSEHQTGLALDIVDASYQVLDTAQESTAVQQWLMANSWEYGFILRYPGEKSDLTGIIYEPWHYRYVGQDAAREMRELGMCLEEYLEWLDGIDK